jgi:iron complex outermembrane receptor protein
MIGFKKLEKPVTIGANQNTEVTDLVLNSDILELAGVEINYDKNKYLKEKPSNSLRIQEPLLEVPQNIQIVTKDVLKDQQVISMSDGLIRNVSGLVRSEHWGDLYTNINARGSQVQAFRNGFNVVNSYWGPLTEDMSFVENIEFVKGPAGFMLSSGDPSGLYNVVTKKPTGITKGEASMTLGSYNLYRATFDLDGKLSNNGRLLYRLNLAAQNKGSFRPNEYNNRYVIAPVLSYQLDEKTKLTAEYNYQRADMSNVGAYYVWSTEGIGKLSRNATELPAGLPGTKINDHSFYLNLQHDFNKNWKITAQAARFVYFQEGSSMWPSSVLPDGKIMRAVSIWDAKSTMNMAQVFVNGNVKTGAINHRILTGIDVAKKDYMADWNQNHVLDTIGGEFDHNNPNLGIPANGYPNFDRSKPLSERAGGSTQTMSYSAFYLQDELGFLENRLRLTLAGRYTYLTQMYYSPDQKANHITPRVGLSASVTKSTAIYALYDQAFIPQNAGKLVNGGKVKPITGNNMEVGVKRDWFGGRWNTTIAVYRILKNNEVVSVNPVLQSFQEIGQKRAQGVEFDLRGEIVKGLNLIANYAYTDSRVIKVEEGVTSITKNQLLPVFAKHTINGWLSYKIQNGFAKGFGVSAGLTTLIDRVTYWDISPNGSTPPDYTKVDAGLFWENDRMRISGNMFNVFDENIYSGSYYSWLNAYYTQYEPGRNVRFAINYKF